MTAELVTRLIAICGPANVATGADAAPLSHDWTHAYHWTPAAVVKPDSTEEVAAIVKLARETGTPIVPVSGNTGLAGGTKGDGAIMLSLARMNRIREVRPDARIAIVEAGVVLHAIHEAADAEGLVFPLTFGARGSAMIGGCLSTNAGGSNVLKYGNTRDLVLGIEAVLPDGRILDAMTELHKNNSGYDLRHLLIGAEGTLGIITAAVLKLSPRPAAFATALIAVRDLPAALQLLNRLQDASGAAVEAFEYMDRSYMDAHAARFPDRAIPLSPGNDVTLMVEIGSTRADDCTPRADGSLPLRDVLENALAEMVESGAVLDAVIAQTEAQRKQFWALREAAAEVALSRMPLVNNDVAVPIDKVATFLGMMQDRLPAIDPGARSLTVSHLGDGNVHYTVWPATDDPKVHDAIMETVEDAAISLGGSFSAEHGIGVTKLPSMVRRKDAVAMDVMRSIKAALDPDGLLNPGKVLPPA